MRGEGRLCTELLVWFMDQRKGMLVFGLINSDYGSHHYNPVPVDTTDGTWQAENLVFYLGSQTYMQVDATFDLGNQSSSSKLQLITSYYAAFLSHSPPISTI